MSKINDKDFDCYLIKEVSEEDLGYGILLNDNFHIYLSKSDAKCIPNKGDRITVYGKYSISIRGIDINGVECYYYSKEELNEKHRKWIIEEENKIKEYFEKVGKALQDEIYRNLPIVFQKRIDILRAKDTNFRWKYEAYELFIYKEAMKIVGTLKEPEAIKKFCSLTLEEQIKIVELDHSHSDNSSSSSIKLAYIYLVRPEILLQY